MTFPPGLSEECTNRLTEWFLVKLWGGWMNTLCVFLWPCSTVKVEVHLKHSIERFY